MDIEKIKQMQLLSSKIPNNDYRYVFENACLNLFFLQEIILKRNVRFEEIDVEIIFNEYEKMINKNIQNK
jgi:hypothetical protein